MNLKLLKIITLLMCVWYIVIEPYITIYEDSLQVEVPSWYLHYYLIRHFAVGMLICYCYPLGVGLFNAKNAKGVQENIVAKKHWIIAGIIMSLAVSNPSLKETLISMRHTSIIVVTWVYLFSLCIRFTLVYFIGVLLGYMNSFFISLRNAALKRFTKQKEDNP